MGILFSISDFNGNVLCFSPFSVVILRYVPDSSNVSRTFIIQACWTSSNTFSISIKITVWYLSLSILYNMLISKPTLHLWDDTNLILMCDLCICHVCRALRYSPMSPCHGQWSSSSDRTYMTCGLLCEAVEPYFALGLGSLPLIYHLRLLCTFNIGWLLESVNIRTHILISLKLVSLSTNVSWKLIDNSWGWWNVIF